MLKIFFFLFVFFAQNVLAGTFCGDKQIMGRSEKVVLVDNHIILDAKLDTGAAMSSLSASDIVIFKKDNQDWVRFSVFTHDTRKKIVLIKPVIRVSHILKRKDEVNLSDSKYSVRPVVLMAVCIGNQKREIKVNLIDRSDFRYPMLIGASALEKFKILVDVGVENLSAPDCGLPNLKAST